MECPPGRLIYKYETGFWGDRCYSRMAGRWKDNGNWTATDWSCTTPSLVVDFVEKTQTLIVGSKNFVEYFLVPPADLGLRIFRFGNLGKMVRAIRAGD